jgi:DNA-directed RNA polymerase subunit RPC12/RpoP
MKIMLKVIRCPHCRCEYFPGEIFQPEHFLGQPKNVVRNNIGEVLGCTGIEMDTTETFTCIKCDKEFTVTASINFNTSVDTDVVVEQPPLF